MVFLYSISNIAIPLLLLIYKTLIDYHDYKLVSYGKWAAVIILIFFFNLIYWIFDDSIWFLLLDMTLKCAIVFLPQNLIQKIQTLISRFHLQILIDKVRCQLINKFHMIHWKITQYALSKLDQDQQKQFKTALIQKLNGIQTKPSTSKSNLIQSKYKIFENIGINCTIITEQMTKKSESTKMFDQSSQNNNKFQSSQANKKFLQSSQTNNPQNDTFSFIPATKQESLPKFNYQKPKPVQSNKSKIQAERPNFALKESNIKYNFQDFDQSPIKPIKQTNKNSTNNNLVKKQETRENHQKKYKDTNEMKINYQQQKHPLKRTLTMDDNQFQNSKTKGYSKQDDESSQILEKLDISASEYSDMFQQDDQDLQPTLACKVEVILQIGVGTNVRLEIYKLELYHNDDLRIVSLYDRQFERHKLISMKKGLHGYYELQLSGGSVHTRKVKFRGQHKAFQKYIITS